MATTMTYGSYNFSPVPLMTYTDRKDRNEAGKKVGRTVTAQLRGSLTDNTGSDTGIITIDGKQDDLRAAIAEDGQLFKITCNATTLLECFPKFNEITFDEGIWVNRSDYTIDMEFEVDDSSNPPYVKSTQEEWQIEYVDEKSPHYWDLPGGTGDYLPYQLRISHNLSAVGKTHYESSGTLGKEPYEYARDWVSARAGIDWGKVQNTGIFNFDPSILSAYNHIRSITINEEGGSFTLNENWLVLSSGNGLAGKAVEDYNISVRTSQDVGYNSITIDGQIQGLAVNDYNDPSTNKFRVVETKYSNASGYWNTVKSRLVGRANLILDSVSTTRDINIVPVATSIAHNPSQGTINYSYEYNDKPSNCISGAKSEVITITDNDPADVFATIFVFGKVNGPVIQNLSTVTPFTRSLTVEVVMESPTGCPNPTFSDYYNQRPTGQVQEIVDSLQQELIDAYSQVLKSEDSSSWAPKEGRFSRSVSWLAGGC